MNSFSAETKIGIVSPASFINGFDEIKLAIDYLSSLGLKCVLGNNLYKQDRFMAGTDEERAADIMGFFKDPEIKAIFTTAGGCGSQRLLDILDYEVIRNNPKPIFGISDNTALQLGIYAQTNNLNYTGFSLKYDFKKGHIDAMVAASLQSVLNGEKQTIQSGETLQSGQASGKLLGGCLSMIRSLCGTPYLPDLTDSILLIEDVGEKTYKLDLMLTQLRQQPSFKGVKGIVFGIFADCIASDEQDGSVDDVLNDFIKHIPNIPVIKNFAYGHIPSRYVLPLGAKVKIDADNCLLEQIG